MSARDEIFANIRRSLGVNGGETIRQQMVADRLERAPKGVIPERGQVSGEERIALFKTRPNRARHGDGSRLPRRCRNPSRSSCAITTCRRRCAWATIHASRRCPGRTRRSRSRRGRSEGSDLNAVSHAFGGMAEAAPP